MSQYQNRIHQLQEKINQLKEQKLVLMQKRKNRIGELAEEFDLLIYSDACIAGIFTDYQATTLTHPHQIKRYEKLGEDYLNKKRRKQIIAPDSPATTKVNSLENAHDRT